MTENKCRKKGTVKAYSKSVNAGVIACDDGKFYSFGKADMREGNEPEDHENVDFDDGHDKNARNVGMRAKKSDQSNFSFIDEKDD